MKLATSFGHHRDTHAHQHNRRDPPRGPAEGKSGRLRYMGRLTRSSTPEPIGAILSNWSLWTSSRSDARAPTHAWSHVPTHAPTHERTHPITHVQEPHRSRRVARAAVRRLGFRILNLNFGNETADLDLPNGSLRLGEDRREAPNRHKRAE